MLSFGSGLRWRLALRAVKRLPKRLRICSSQLARFQFLSFIPLRPASSHQAYSRARARRRASRNSGWAEPHEFERFADHAECGGDFRLAAALPRQLKHAAAMGPIVKGRAAARTRARDFEIAGHGTSQEFVKKCGKERSYRCRCGLDIRAIDWAVRMLFCDCTDL